MDEEQRKQLLDDLLEVEEEMVLESVQLLKLGREAEMKRGDWGEIC